MSNVRVSERKPSPTDYMNETRQLAIRVGQIVSKKPQKYKMNYGDHIIKTSLEAWELVQTANSVYMCKTASDEAKSLRLDSLLKARAKVRHLSSVMTLFLDMTMGESGDKAKKVMNREETAKVKAEIGGWCRKIIAMIEGVMKSDKKYL